MYFSKILIVAVAAAPLVFSPAAASAHPYNDRTMNVMSPGSQGYTGNWPVTITNSQFSNGTDCLTLNGTSKSGTASLVAGGQRYPYGSYVVVRGILVANITEPLYGQNGVLTFTAHANNGQPSKGLFEDLRGGSNFDFGDLAFGSKNGC
jgi:hypothetical protein